MVEVQSRLIELAPEKVDAHIDLGIALANLGNLKEAVVAFKKGIEIHRDNANLYNDLGMVLTRLGDLPGAVAAHGKAVELAPDDPTVGNGLAWLLATCADAKLRNPARAVELATRAVESAKKAADLAPQEGNFQNTLGVARYRAGDWPAAVEALGKSIELRGGGDASDGFFLAMSQWQLGNKDDARKSFDAAVKWMEKNAPRNEEFLRFRAEAEQLLEIPSATPPSAPGEPPPATPAKPAP